MNNVRCPRCQSLMVEFSHNYDAGSSDPDWYKCPTCLLEMPIRLSLTALEE